MSSSRRYDLEEIKRLLVDDLERLAEDVMGSPNPDSRNKKDWRWGDSGRASLCMRGPKRGKFHAFNGGAYGGVFAFIMHGHACDFDTALRYAKAWLIIDDSREETPHYEADRERERKRLHAEAGEAREIANSQKFARRLASESIPVRETLGEEYLVHARKAAPELMNFPDSIRYHEGLNALVVCATNDTAIIERVQLVYLGLDGKKLSKEELERRDVPRNGKQTFGRNSNAPVRLPGPANGPLNIAEGPETGISAWAATGHETLITLGSMAPAPLRKGRRIVVCRDDDPKYSPADRRLREILRQWRKKGLDVVVATPWPSRRYNRSDLNDVAQADGLDAVRERIHVALNPDSEIRIRVSLKEARQRLESAVACFFDKALEFDKAVAETFGDVPPVHAIKIDTGAGKSREVRHKIVSVIADMRNTGDKRSIAYLVPTHKLGDEHAAALGILHKARTTGLTVEVWRGLDREDPSAQGKKMCHRYEAAKDALDVGLQVQSSVCRKKAEDGTYLECPFYRECGYQRQRTKKADIWIAAHDLIFAEKPATFGDLAMVIVDEGCWRAGLSGVEGKPLSFSLDSLYDPAEKEAQAFNELMRDPRPGVLAVLRAQPDGPVARKAIVEAPRPLTKTEANEARRLEYRKLVDPGMHPAMTDAERREAKREASGNRTALRLAEFWAAMEALISDGGPQASGWASLATVEGEHGHTRVIHLKGRRKIRGGWQVPVLHLDATLNADLLRHFWPQLTVTANIAIETAYVTVRQVIDRAYSKAMLEQIELDDCGNEDPEARREARRRNRNLRRLHAILHREARRYAPQGRTLIVVQQAVEEALPSIAPLPSQVDLAHHNAVAGRDEWRDCRALIPVGRTMPSPAAVERMAEALTGSAIEPLGPKKWFERADAVREVVSGEWPCQTTNFLPAEADRHPDPTCEAIRWEIAEGQLIQIIGRGRGVNRTADIPLHILLLVDTPLPVPVSELLEAKDLEPSIEDLQLAAGGIAYDAPADRSAAYPCIWSTKGAAEQAARRARSHTDPYKYTFYRGTYDSSALRRLEYQLAGKGQKPRSALYDPGVVPDPEATLRSHLGPVSWCWVDGPSSPDQPRRDPPPSAGPGPGERPLAVPVVIRAGLGRVFIPSYPAHSWRPEREGRNVCVTSHEPTGPAKPQQRGPPH